ncbi:MAG: 6-phosphogluconolactonase [Pseudomonadota bacterium]
MKTPEILLPAGVKARFGESPERVGAELADAVAEVLRHRLAEAGQATLAVSGGSTPLPFFDALSAKDLDWARVVVVLTDERWVDEDDPASNTRLVRSALLQNNAADAKFLSLKQPGEMPGQGLDAVKSKLAGLPWPLDVLILGMGNDGHTASLFPDAPQLAFAMSPRCPDAAAAMTPPSQKHKRITLTRPVLSSAGFTALHLKGEDKLETLKQALQSPERVLEMPVRAFLLPGLQVFWSP